MPVIRSWEATTHNMLNSVRLKKFAFIFALVFAGEMIFSVSFHVTRFFRPTFLEAFGLSNTQLGDIFAYYGVTAMVSYYLGGPLADRFQARTLMSIALIGSALCGFYLSTIPGYRFVAMVYAILGITTIFLFWAAMIKATRDWGGQHDQGKAFGILDGGRGLVAAVMAGLAVNLLANQLANDTSLVTSIQREQALTNIFQFYSWATLLAAVFVWQFVPSYDQASTASTRQTIGNMLAVIRRLVTWAHAAIIVCAYCAYKGLDHYSLYAVEVLNMSEVDAAKFTAYGAYLRPLGAIAAGLLADRFSASKITLISFAVLVALFLQLGFSAGSGNWIVVVNMLVSYVFVFAFRGLYYALLEDTHVPASITGTTVGVIAFVGYTPDIFFGAITGRILDASPGVTGHQHYFLFLSVIAFIGVITTILLMWANKLPSRIKPTPTRGGTASETG